MFEDLRDAVRSVLRSPFFAASAVGCLALAVGAAASVCSLFDAVLLRPLSFREPDRLVALRSSSPKRGLLSEPVSGADFLDWQQQGKSFEGMAAFQWCRADLSSGSRSERLEGLCVTHNFISVLGAELQSGRLFTFDEQQTGAPVALMGQRLWRNRFAADTSIEGKPLELHSWLFGPSAGRVHTVVGVLPAGLDFFPAFTHYQIADVGAGEQLDFFMPIRLNPQQRAWRDYDVIARLKQGVTLEQAQIEMQTIAQRLEGQYPDSNEGWQVAVVPLHTYLAGNISRELTLLFGAAGFVLLIGFGSFVHFHWERRTLRQREIVTRMALGATRPRVIRQMLAESFLLAVAGAAAGLLLAQVGTDLLITLAPSNVHGLGETAIDLRLAAFTFAASILIAVGAAVPPAVAGLKQGNLREAAHAFSPDRRTSRVRDLLLVSGAASLLVLSIDAGAMITSLGRLLRVNPGFDPHSLLTMTLSLPQGSREWNYQAAFYDEVIEKIGALPGVRGAAVVKGLPLAGLDFNFGITVEGQPPLPPVDRPTCQIHIVSRDYLQVMKIPLLEGRLFTEQEYRGEVGFAPAVLVNETMARRYWGAASAVGKRFRTNPDIPVWSEIVGVVSDVKQTRLDADAKPTVYYPQNLFPQPAISLLVRTESDPRMLISPAVGAIQSMGSDVFITNIRTMDEILEQSTANRSFTAAALSLLGVIALGLALAGLSSVVAQSIASRAKEIGVRAALGAHWTDIFGLIVGRTMLLVLIGVVIALPLAHASLRLLAGLLFEAPGGTFAVFAVTPLLVLLAAFVACCIPTRRLTRIDPLAALRSD
jgi:putative ABC transport system permease protein